MNDAWGEASSARPVLLGRLGKSTLVRATRGGSTRIEFRDRAAQTSRVDRRLDEAFLAFQDEIRLSKSLAAADPELVLVFEALDERSDLTQVATSLGLEILFEAEGAQAPTDEFVLISDKPNDPMIGACLHALCLNTRAFEDLQRHWKTFKKTGQVPGIAPLRDLFGHLKDVRAWGPADRLKSIDWDEYFNGRIDDRPHSIEIELWYRQTARARDAAQQAVTELIRREGGRVTASASISGIGYHALRCEVDTQTLKDLANGRFDEVQVVKSANVMYLRVTGQAREDSVPPAEEVQRSKVALPVGSPVLCLLDGVPESNHPLLADRVEIFDPDSLEDLSIAAERKHGTSMASTAIWGDLARGEAPLDRPILVRPVLHPANDTIDRVEEMPPDELIPDLMWRVFRELFDGVQGLSPAGADVVIVNISVGDPTTPYDTALSSWARMIDWLSYKYGVLVVVSAGNHPRLSLSGRLNSVELAALGGIARRAAVLQAQADDQANRRLLSPAESINALTVGASHDDGSGPFPAGYLVDPTDGLPAVSPISALGGGYRRSIKPELVAPGGKVYFSTPMSAEDGIVFISGTSRGPGIRVAAPGSVGETHTSGTSPAAALVSRQAARVHETVVQITRELNLTKRQRAVAIKALLVHGASPLEGQDCEILSPERTFGHGLAARDYSAGCARNEAVVLYVGTIGAGEEQELLLPLPDGLSVRETKRITATLAWLTPVNWRHRQYRRASLSFAKPAGDIPVLKTPITTSSDIAKRGATTVQHLSWELESAFGSGSGSNLRLRVKCFEQAGGLNGERVDFAVALSLWVAPALQVDVYSQVQTQIQTRVPVAPRPQ